MKKMTLVLAVVAALASCNEEFDVKLKNGSIVKAQEAHGRKWKSGDTVCISQGSDYGEPWLITNDGRMVDTITYFTYRNSDSIRVGYLTQYKVGIIR